MTNSEFYKIIDMNHITVSLLKTSHFSLATSPYYAHQHGLAIDIYQSLTLENYEVLSPISGVIIKTKTMIAPKPKFKEGLNKEYLTLIQNKKNPKIVYKILHVDPKIKEGDVINKGDIIGETVRNGYFAYWSSPHLHLEIRPYHDAIRASGGKSFSLLTANTVQPKTNPEKRHSKQIALQIHSNFPEFLLAKLPEDFYCKINPIYGIRSIVNNTNCILDGGIPQYKNGIIIIPNEEILKTSESIYLNRHEIGTLSQIRNQFGFFKFNNLKFVLNNEKIRGISLYLANFLPLLKIIPYKCNEFSFKPNSIQNLRVISNQN